MTYKNALCASTLLVAAMGNSLHGKDNVASQKDSTNNCQWVCDNMNTTNICSNLLGVEDVDRCCCFANSLRLFGGNKKQYDHDGTYDENGNLTYTTANAKQAQGTAVPVYDSRPRIAYVDASTGQYCAPPESKPEDQKGLTTQDGERALIQCQETCLILWLTNVAFAYCGQQQKPESEQQSFQKICGCQCLWASLMGMIRGVGAGLANFARRTCGSENGGTGCNVMAHCLDWGSWAIVLILEVSVTGCSGIFSCCCGGTKKS